MNSDQDKLKLIGLDFRLLHIILIMGSGFLLYSALSMDDDGEAVHSVYNMFILHRYIGLLWGLIITIYAIYAISRKKQLHILEPISNPLNDQIKEGFSVIGKYFFGRHISEKVRKKMGRHNVMASYAFVMMTFGLFLLAVGGIGMISFQTDSGLYELCLGIHLAGAGLLALFVLAHLFAVINRSNWPLLGAVFTTGRVGKSWARQTMPKHITENSQNGEITGESLVIFERN